MVRRAPDHVTFIDPTVAGIWNPTPVSSYAQGVRSPGLVTLSDPGLSVCVEG